MFGSLTRRILTSGIAVAIGLGSTGAALAGGDKLPTSPTPAKTAPTDAGKSTKKKSDAKKGAKKSTTKHAKSSKSHAKTDATKHGKHAKSSAKKHSTHSHGAVDTERSNAKLRANH